MDLMDILSKSIVVLEKQIQHLSFFTWVNLALTNFFCQRNLWLPPPANEPASLLFANAVDVRHVHLDGSATHNEVVKTRETLALDFLHRNRTVCWISHNNRDA
jgi:hypothetical protein